MIRRNWLDLSRKLVDRFDLDFSMNAIQAAAGKDALAYWGEGVLATQLYPNPFLMTLSGIALGGAVSQGVAYDDNGQNIEADSPTNNFTIPTSDPVLPRWDLLVLRYKMTGDTPVPKPSDPITMVFLNLHDDFDLVVIPGSPNASPAYPAKLAHDVIVWGLQVPAAATLGTQVTADISVRDLAFNRALNITQDLSAGNTTVPLGSSMIYPDLIIRAQDIFTIAGNLISINQLTVNGTLTVTGAVRVL